MTDLNKLKDLREKAEAMVSSVQAAGAQRAFYIAANPQAILELLDRLEKAEAVIQLYVDVFGKNHRARASISKRWRSEEDDQALV